MQRFSSDQLPERDRIAIWREVFGREVFRVDIEAPADSRFIGDVTVHSLPGLKLLSGTLGAGVHGRRTRELISDGVCDLLLTVNRRGQMLASQRGQDRSLEPGDATLGSLGEVGGIFRKTKGESVSLQIPHAALAPLVPKLDEAVARPIPRDQAALRLLIPYLDLLRQSGALAASEFAQSAMRHIYDLVVLTLASSPDALDVASDRGGRAARLATIKADIIANIARPDLSADMIARRHGVSPRYIHRLFEKDDRSFAQFIMEQKLSCAHRMLTDPGFTEWSIGAIAEQAGFAERSHFNRALRRRYGASPSELRGSVQRGEGR
jgi:AraC-like DNA-binding protein